MMLQVRFSYKRKACEECLNDAIRSQETSFAGPERTGPKAAEIKASLVERATRKRPLTRRALLAAPLTARISRTYEGRQWQRGNNGKWVAGHFHLSWEQEEEAEKKTSLMRVDSCTDINLAQPNQRRCSIKSLEMEIFPFHFFTFRLNGLAGHFLPFFLPSL